MAQLTKKNNFGVLLSAFAFILILAFQGGYFALPVFIVGAVLCFILFIASISKVLRPKFSLVTALLLLLSIIYLISAVINCWNLTAVISACVPGTLAAVSILFGSIVDKDSRALLYKIITWVGVASAVVGLFAYFALHNLEYFVMSERLTFPFGYSNTSAIWYAVTAILCVTILQGRQKFACVLPIAALLLTRSVGAIGLALIIAAIIYINWLAKSDTPTKTKKVSAVIVAIILACGIALAFIFSSRVIQASQTFIERYIQVMDGFGLLASSPIFGIGPDQWQFMYPYIQTAQYTASKIHCSFMQILLDGGVVAFLAVAALIIFSYVKLVKQHASLSLLLGTFLLVHSVVDFDLSFPTVVILLILLVECPVRFNFNECLSFVEIDSQTKTPVNPPKFISIIFIVICCIFSFAGFFFQMQMNGVATAGNNSAKAESYVQTQNKLILNDPKAVTYIKAGLVNDQKFQVAADFATDLQHPTTTNVVLNIRAIAGTTRVDDAVQYMKDSLQKQPYNADLYSMVHDLLQNNNFSQQYKDAYNECAQTANAKLETGNSVLLSEHKTYDLF